MAGSLHVGLAALGAAIGVGLIGAGAAIAVGRNPGAATPGDPPVPREIGRRRMQAQAQLGSPIDCPHDAGSAAPTNRAGDGHEERIKAEPARTEARRQEVMAQANAQATKFIEEARAAAARELLGKQ